MLEKTIKTDLQMQEYLKSMDNAMEAITGKLYIHRRGYPVTLNV